MKKKLCFVMLFVSFTIGLFGTEIFVYAGESIQDAIDMSVNGDIITVYNGEYVENLVIENKSITLRSESGNSDQCIINGNYNGHVIEINFGDYVIIQGFTIKNSGTNYINNPLDHTDVYDSGIFSYFTDVIKIQHNKFTNNYCGIYMKIIRIKAEITSNTFDDLIYVPIGSSKFIFWHGYEYLSANMIIKDNYFYKTYPSYLNSLIDCWYCNIEIINNEFSIHRANVIDIRHTSLITVNKNNFIFSYSGTAVVATNTDLIMNFNSIIYEDGSTGTAVQCYSGGYGPTDYKTGYFAENLIVGGTKGFRFEDIEGSPANFHGFFKNNIVSLCETAIHIENVVTPGAENNILEFKNNIIWNVDTAFDIERELIIPINIEFSCIEGGVPVDPSIINGEGNIDDDPLFAPDYHLSENSPCIDTADPDTDGDGVDWIYDEDDRDLDGSRKDIGCYPFLHDYDTKHFHKGWNWTSVPILDVVPGEEFQYADEFLKDEENEPTIPHFTWIKGKRKIGGEWEFMDITYDPEEPEPWSDFDDFENKLYRHEGYKIEVTDDSGEEILIVTGERIEPDYPLNFEYGIYHWYGYFLPYNQNIKDAFGDHWEDVYMVKAEKWTYFCGEQPRGTSEPVWGMTPDGKTMEYGKTYVIKMKNEVTGFTWNDSGIEEEPVKKGETQFFTYQDKPDYEVIEIDSIAGIGNMVEIGVFEDGACVGAAVADTLPVQVLAYTDQFNRDGTTLSFQVETGRGIPQVIKSYSVLNFETGKYEMRPLVSGQQEYSVIRLGEGDYEEVTPVQKIVLSKNYPNPFNPTTTILFSLPEEMKIDLSIYNIRGQKVRTLYKGKAGSGQHTVIWNGKDNNEKPVSSGIYFYKLETGGKGKVRKMLLLK